MAQETLTSAHPPMVSEPHPRRVFADVPRFGRTLLVGSVVGAPVILGLVRYYNVTLDQAGAVAAVPFCLMYCLHRGAPLLLQTIVKKPETKPEPTPRILEPFFFGLGFAVMFVFATLSVAISQLAYRALNVQWAVTAAPTWIFLLLVIATAWVLLSISYLLALIAYANRQKIYAELSHAVGAFEARWQSRIVH